MNDTIHTDALRESADDLADDLEQLADALDDGTATGDDVRDAYRHVAASTMVELEDAAASRDAIDDTSSRQRAIDEARAAIYYLNNDTGGAALRSLVAAAEHADAAYNGE